MNSFISCVCARLCVYLRLDKPTGYRKSLMLLHKIVLEEIRRLIPGARYNRLGRYYVIFSLSHGQYVAMDKRSGTTVVVRIKLLNRRADPTDGFVRDGETYGPMDLREGIADNLGVMLAPYTEDTDDE